MTIQVLSGVWIAVRWKTQDADSGPSTSLHFHEDPRQYDEERWRKELHVSSVHEEIERSVGSLMLARIEGRNLSAPQRQAGAR